MDAEGFGTRKQRNKVSAQFPLLANVQPLPSRQARGTCAHCGGKIPKVFKHTLCKGLVSVLWKLYRTGKPTKLGELGLTNSEFANCQKLSYFRLAQSVDGLWALTDRGFWFLSNRIEVEKYVHTKAGKVVEREGSVKVSEIDSGWWQKVDYARESRRA